MQIQVQVQVKIYAVCQIEAKYTAPKLGTCGIF